MQDLELSVTICSWNTQSDLHACLRSLEALVGEASYEVIVIDNNSEDESADMVETDFPWVRLYRMEHNLGFTGGHNYALAQRKAPHALLLNSDTIVHAGALRTLLEYSKDHPEAGIIGPKLLNPDGSLQYSCRHFPNPGAALFRNTFLGKWFPNNPFTKRYLMSDWNHNEPREVDWVSGAAFLATSRLMDKIGFMDPEYFMFCEDVDWCFRAWEAGFKVVYLPQTVITHAIGRSTDKAPNRMIGRFHRSMFRFYQKNMLPKLSPFLRPLAYAAAAGALTLRATLFIAKNRIDDMKRRGQQ